MLYGQTATQNLGWQLKTCQRGSWLSIYVQFIVDCPKLFGVEPATPPPLSLSVPQNKNEVGYSVNEHIMVLYVTQTPYMPFYPKFL